LQLWPLPHGDCCPCAFCDELLEARQMETHLAQKHPVISHRDLYYSQLHLTLAGLAGIDLRVRKEGRWYCPFHHCAHNLDTYSAVSEHVRDNHPPDEKVLFEGLGGFWAPLIAFYHREGRWPTVQAIMDVQHGTDQVTAWPMQRELAQEQWVEGGFRAGAEKLGDGRVLSESSLEGLIQILRASASAQLAAEAIDSTPTSISRRPGLATADSPPFYFPPSASLFYDHQPCLMTILWSSCPEYSMTVHFTS
jgi:hypothetical protein